MGGDKLDTSEAAKAYARATGYGRSSGYGTSGYGQDDGYGGYQYDEHRDHSSGYGYSQKKVECCELVVDPLSLLALLGFIAFATAFFNVLITMNIGKKRRKRSEEMGIEPQPDMKSQTLGAVFGDILLSGRMTWGLNDVARSKSHTGGVIVVMASD